MRDLMFKGKRTYSEFAASEERISSNILAERLRALAAAGVIRKYGTGRTTCYSLTAKGLDLLPLMVEMILWSGRHDPNTAAPVDFLRRAHKDRAGFLARLEEEIRSAHGL